MLLDKKKKSICTTFPTEEERLEFENDKLTLLVVSSLTLMQSGSSRNLTHYYFRGKISNLLNRRRIAFRRLLHILIYFFL